MAELFEIERKCNTWIYTAVSGPQILQNVYKAEYNIPLVHVACFFRYIMKDGQAIERTQLSQCFIFFLLDKCILFIYFLKLFYNLLHLYWLGINIWVFLQERRELLECEYLPPPIPTKRSQQMTAKLIFCIHPRVQSYSVFRRIYIPCSVPTTWWVKT